MAQTINHTKKRKKSPKQLSWYDKYKFLNTWKRQVSPAFIEKLTQELVEHIQDPTVTKIGPFIRERGMNWEMFLSFVNKNKNLKEAYHYVIEEIGDRREDMSVYKKYNCNPQSLNFTLRHYHPFWRKTHDEEDAVKTNENTKLIEALKGKSFEVDDL